MTSNSSSSSVTIDNNISLSNSLNQTTDTSTKEDKFNGFKTAKGGATNSVSDAKEDTEQTSDNSTNNVPFVEMKADDVNETEQGNEANTIHITATTDDATAEQEQTQKGDEVLTATTDDATANKEAVVDRTSFIWSFDVVTRAVLGAFSEGDFNGFSLTLDGKEYQFDAKEQLVLYYPSGNTFKHEDTTLDPILVLMDENVTFERAVQNAADYDIVHEEPMTGNDDVTIKVTLATRLPREEAVTDQGEAVEACRPSIANGTPSFRTCGIYNVGTMTVHTLHMGAPCRDAK